MANNFWGNSSFEPKRAFRFLVSLMINNEQLNYSAKSVDRPSYTVGEQSHQFFNHTFYYPGRVTWNTVQITLVDAVTPGGADALYKYLDSVGVANPVGKTMTQATSTTITKASATTALGTVKIREIGTSTEINASPDSLEQGLWTLHNPFITEVNFGSHSYDSDEMVEITVTLRYDWAEYTGHATPKQIPS